MEVNVRVQGSAADDMPLMATEVDFLDLRMLRFAS
jgi:hypothetical protein